MKLSDILNPASVKVPLTATDKNNAIAELVDLLYANRLVKKRDGFLNAVLTREQTSSTGIGNGLAVPHGKSFACQQLVMAVGKPQSPIAYDSIDGEPVKIIILLGSPLNQTGPHIQALARISRLMSQKPCRLAVQNAATGDELYHAIVDNDL